MYELDLFLPVDLLSCADNRGNEYAWRWKDLPRAADEAEKAGLASDGWRALFRTPDGICEFYWSSFVPEPREDDEPWNQYVSRTWGESRRKWQELFENEELIEEGRKIFKVIQETESPGVLPRDALWFILYFGLSTPGNKGPWERPPHPLSE